MFEHGINLQAPGKIRIKLPKGTVRFEAEIGIDDWVNPETYRLPQPYYYQPHHFSTAALRKRGRNRDRLAERRRSFSRDRRGRGGKARSLDSSCRRVLSRDDRDDR